MAGRGPAPDPNRARRSGGQAPWTELPAAPGKQLRGIPKKGQRGGWHKATKSWWRAMTSSSMATLYDDTDWAYLEGVMLPLMERFQREGHPKELASELRLAGQRLGATVADRMALRIRATGAASPSPKAQAARQSDAQDVVEVDHPIFSVINGGAETA
ncbi:MAG: hypothetical protein AAGA17_00210 [Actinomycetota bacterium]